MKKNLILLLGFLFGIIGFCSADLAGYEIKNYQADFQLNSEGILKVQENIEVNFNEYRHGIYRDIPFMYPKADYTLKTPISHVKVDGYQFSTSENGNDFRIKIGSPDFQVIGRQLYPIRYQVRGAVKAFTGYQELYWNMLGTNWNTEIKNFNFSVSLPSDLELEPEVEYYAVWGNAGSKDRIKLEKIGNIIKNLDPISLEPHQAVTIAVKLPENYLPVQEFMISNSSEQSEVDILAANFLLLSFSEKIGEYFGFLDNEGTFLSQFFLFVFFLFIFGLIFRKLLKKLYFFLFLKKKNNIRDIVYYTPPKIQVGEMALLFHKAPVINSLFATLYDWKCKNIIDIEPNYNNIVIKRKMGKTDFSSIFESELWKKLELDQNDLFILNNQSVLFSNNDENFISEIMAKKIHERYTPRSLKYWEMPSLLYKEAFSFRFPSIHFNSFGFIVFLIFGVPIFIKFGVLFFVLLGMLIMPEDPLFRPVMLVIVLIVFSPKLTKLINDNLLEYTLSAALEYEASKGYQKYLQKVEGDNLKHFLETDPSYFEKVLPYAIAFGMEAKWIEKCQHLFETLDNQAAIQSINHASFSLTCLHNISSYSVRPSSSSSSSSDFGSYSAFDSDGGSGGGRGSSGGGGGGGGGGSW